jgi:arylsulfatase A-like enzyme
MISEVDAQLGRVARELERRREWDDTLVIVTSDHGDQGLLGKLAF